MSREIEESWETADTAQKLRLLADHVVTARVGKGNALAEMTDMLGFYRSEEWMHRGIPAEAVNEAINQCRDAFETMDFACAVANDRLNEAVARSVHSHVSPSQVTERLIVEAFARHGTDHSVENTAVPTLLAEYGVDKGRELDRER